MAVCGKLGSVVCVVCWLCLGNVAASAGRLKRELRFPKGGSLVTAVALSSTLPKGPTDGWVHVLEFDLGFPFPDRLVYGKAQAEKKVWKDRREGTWSRSGSRAKKKQLKRLRRERLLKTSQRRQLLLQIEDAMTRGGFNGSSCVSRFLCDLRHISPKTSLLEELLSALFPPSHTHHQQCQLPHPHCPISLLHAIMHSEHLPPTQGASPPLTDAAEDSIGPYPPPPPSPAPAPTILQLNSE